MRHMGRLIWTLSLWIVCASAGTCGQYPSSMPWLGLLVAKNNSSASTSPPIVATPQWKIFVTAGVSSPYIGVSGFDADCMGDTNKPADSSVYKAMIVEGTTRRACSTPMCGGGAAEGIDWVLKPSHRYVRASDSADLFTAGSAAVFSFGTWSNPPDAAALSFWTGLTASWTNSPSNCLSWANNLGGTFGATGNSSSTNSSVISATALDCTGSYHLLCVEQ